MQEPSALAHELETTTPRADRQLLRQQRGRLFAPHSLSSLPAPRSRDHDRGPVHRPESSRDRPAAGPERHGTSVTSGPRSHGTQVTWDLGHIGRRAGGGGARRSLPLYVGPMNDHLALGSVVASHPTHDPIGRYPVHARPPVGSKGRTTNPEKLSTHAGTVRLLANFFECFKVAREKNRVRSKLVREKTEIVKTTSEKNRVRKNRNRFFESARGKSAARKNRSTEKTEYGKTAPRKFRVLSGPLASSQNRPLVRSEKPIPPDRVPDRRNGSGASREPPRQAHRVPGESHDRPGRTIPRVSQCIVHDTYRQQDSVSLSRRIASGTYRQRHTPRASRRAISLPLRKPL